MDSTREWVLQDGRVVRAQEQLFRIVLQDLEVDASSTVRIRHGVTPDRQFSIHDPEMRHGRKSKSERIDGYKRYLATDLTTEVRLEGCVLPANVAEAKGADTMKPTLESYGPILEVAIDRAFLSSDLVQQVGDKPDGKVVCRPYQPRRQGL